MLNGLRSFFRVRALKFFCLALISLSLLTGIPAVFALDGAPDPVTTPRPGIAFDSVTAYGQQRPDEYIKLIGAAANGQGTATVTGPSAIELAGAAATIGAGMALPDAAGRLATISGYSPSEIQKGLQRLADRYCLQNPTDCYGARRYYYQAYSTNLLQRLEYTDQFFIDAGDPSLVETESCNAEFVYAYASNNKVSIPGSVLLFPGLDYGDCIDLGTLKVLPLGYGSPKTFGDLTPEQKRKAIALATPADFVPNPGTFDIPEDGTQLIPNGAPVFFPDPLSGDKLTPVSGPFPTIDNEASQDNTDRSEAAESTTETADGDVPQPRKADAETGKHSPKNKPETIRSVILQNPDKTPVVGQWQESQAAYDAVANLDTSKMENGKAYSVPIPEGAGKIYRYNPNASVDAPPEDRVTVGPADRAVVIRYDNSPKIHTYPAGPESDAYNRPAPLK